MRMRKGKKTALSCIQLLPCGHGVNYNHQDKGDTQ